jgi:hypothetical protein
MKQITQEWIDKAEGDFATAHREIQVREMPNIEIDRLLRFNHYQKLLSCNYFNISKWIEN